MQSFVDLHQINWKKKCISFAKYFRPTRKYIEFRTMYTCNVRANKRKEHNRGKKQQIPIKWQSRAKNNGTGENKKE